jgi:hypothetical protein
VKANGNGVASSRCPHDCPRCRAIELGLGNKPLTSGEFVAVHAGLVEPSREGRVVWSQETLEAQLAVEVAHVAYEEAGRMQRDLLARAEHETRKVERLDQGGQSPRLREIELAVDAAREELDDARKRLYAASVRYRALADADSARHRQEQLRQMYESAAAERAGLRDAKKVGRKGVLQRFRT